WPVPRGLPGGPSPTGRRGGPDPDRPLRLRHACDVETPVGSREGDSRCGTHFANYQGVRKFSEARVAPTRFQISLKRRLRAIRAHPLLNPTALAEEWREWLRSYPADPTHEPPLVAAIEWLVRAQDATAGGGLSLRSSHVWPSRSGGPGGPPW